MKFNIQDVPEPLYDNRPMVGDVYPAQGNRPTAMWVVIGISQGGEGRTAYMLGIDRSGNICSTVSYNFIALEDRHKIGRVTNIDELTLTVQPLAGGGRAFA